MTDTAPVLLPPNQFPHFYRGGDRIGALRGGPGGPMRPEEWIGSTVTRFGEARSGLSQLPDGRLLRDAVAADPLPGSDRSTSRRYGDSSELLVKLLDPDQRLPVHFHPDKAFARRHLALDHGKTEAWIVLEAPEGTGVGLGFSAPMTKAQVLDLVERRDSADPARVVAPPGRPGRRDRPGAGGSAARHRRRRPGARAAGAHRPLGAAGVGRLRGRRGARRAPRPRVPHRPRRVAARPAAAGRAGGPGARRRADRRGGAEPAHRPGRRLLPRPAPARQRSRGRRVRRVPRPRRRRPGAHGCRRHAGRGPRRGVRGPVVRRSLAGPRRRRRRVPPAAARRSRRAPGDPRAGRCRRRHHPGQGGGDRPRPAGARRARRGDPVAPPRSQRRGRPGRARRRDVRRGRRRRPRGGSAGAGRRHDRHGRDGCAARRPRRPARAGAGLARPAR